jgi:quinol monooxygenase YgiN
MRVQELNMKTEAIWRLAAAALTLSLMAACAHSSHRGSQDVMVRIAELEIDPAQLEPYKAELREEIEASIRLEPGVLTLYAVALKESPTSIRIVETYADADAYKAHIESVHFKKYKKNTETMVRALRLVETEPVMLGARPR